MADGADVATAPAINIAIASDEEAPFGLLGVVNSTMVHCAMPAALRFHLIVPNARRALLRSQLERLWPRLHVRTYSLDGGGVRAKIARHLRQSEREPLFASPFRYAVAYLPSLLPVRRVLFLHTDVLLRADVAPLYASFELAGAPAAAVEDCATPLSALVDTASPALSSFSPSSCALDPALMLLDLDAWLSLDVPSRIEYWLAQNRRLGGLFALDAAAPPLVLALLPLYRRLPREWNVAHLGRRRLSDPEIAHWRDFWKGHGVRYSATTSGPTLVITAGGGLPAAKALHYHGRLKPWLLPGAKPLAEPLCRSLTEGGQPQPRDEPCRALWEPYAEEAIAKLGLQRSGPGSAAARAELAALAEAKVEPADMPRLAPLEQEAAEAAKPSGVHVALLASAGPPYGLVAAINSTLAHAAAATLPRLRFHVLAPPSEQPALARKLARIFPAEVRLAITSPPSDKLAKLAPKLGAVGVQSAPFEWPLLWLHLALPADVRRVVLLPTDAVVRTDLQELASAALHGKAGAAFEDCSVTFDALFNYRHPLFRDRHGRPSCSLDSELLLLDVKAWRKEEAPKQLLELVGFQRRNENLFLQPVAALSPHVPAQLLLDKRVLRLPGRWLARGLAREGWSWSEASYWHRLWGLQGVRLPFDVRPVRAVHAAPAPRRASGDALLLRFSGGPMKPWLKRCGGAEAAGAPLCGRSGADCAKLWLHYISEQSLLLAEANEEGSLVAVEGSSARLACVTDLALKKRRAELEALVFDADAAHSRGIERAVVVQAGAPPPPRRVRIVYNQTHARRRGHGHASKPHAAPKKREKGSFELPGTALLRGSRPRGGTSRDARGRER